jgi:O-antigen ligase
MIFMQGYTIKSDSNLNALIWSLELFFLFILFKDANFTIFIILFAFSIPIICRFPEFGLAIALTGRILLHFLFDDVVLSIPIPALLIYLFMIIGGIAVIMLQRPAPSSLTIKAPQTFALFIFAVLAMGSFYSTNPAYAFQKLAFYFMFNIVLIFLPLLFSKDIGKIENIFIFAYLLGLLLGLITTYLALFSPDRMRYQPSENVNPIWFSRSLGISLLSSLYLLKKLKRRLFKLLIIFTYPLFIFPMLRSWSRGPLLGIFLCLFLFYFFQPSTTKKQKIIAAAAVLIGSAVFLLFTSNHIVARLRMPLSEEMSAAFRMLAWIKSVQLFQAHPLFGIGTGSFFINFPLNPFIYPHNIFLEIACENGITGVILLCSFVYFTIKIAVQTIQKSTGKSTQLVVMSLTLFFYALWNSLLSGDISTNENIWLTAGLITALAIGHQTNRQDSNAEKHFVL